MTGKPYRTPRSMLSAVTLMSGTRDVADDILRLYNGVGGRRWVPDHGDSGHVQHAADNLFDRAYLRSRLRRRAVPVTDSWASFSVSHAVSELHAAMNLYHLSNASQPHRTSEHRSIFGARQKATLAHDGTHVLISGRHAFFCVSLLAVSVWW